MTGQETSSQTPSLTREGCKYTPHPMRRSAALAAIAQISTVLILLFVVSALTMFAQTAGSGTIIGTVTDQSGAVVPDATVTITDKATNTATRTTTNSAGHYVFANVNPGTYDIKISKQGFQTVLVQGQGVEVGRSLTEDVRLTVGAVTQEITVETTGTELQTLNSTVGNTVTGVALDSLPQLGRNDVSTFVTLQPGVSPDGSVAGAVVDQSSFMLDGGQNTNDMDGSMSVYTPSFAGDATGGLAGKNSQGLVSAPTGVIPTPADSIEEFKVNTANQGVDFNSAAGAQVQVVTKRGTNIWHGSVYEYYFKNKWNANTWDNNLSKTPVPNYHYSRFGASLGGPLTSKEILGGKTFFFANYQGFIWNNVQTIERDVPTVGMQLGLLQGKVKGVRTVINMNPVAVTYPANAPAIGALVPGTTYQPTACPQNANGLCDPRATLGVASSGGINPTVQAMWNKYLPASIINDPACTVNLGSRCDGFNVQGFKANVAIPQKDNNGVIRLDHDFGSKNHFMASYRYYQLTRTTNNQIDIGGFFAGDTAGVAKAVSTRPQVPWFYVAGLTTNISTNFTNEFHYSFLRNYWAYQSNNDPPQLSGLGGALEPLGEQHYQVLAPYNVDNQNTRVRFWDGKDHFLRDDLSLLHGNHLFSFGGSFQHNFNWHVRSDNGGTINFNNVYQLGDSLGAGLLQNVVSSTFPAGFGSSKTGWGRYVSSVLGVVTDSQVVYTRSGANLTLNPTGTLAVNRSQIPYYNAYFSDTWRLKPSLTVTYGLGWALEMPPHEMDGNQVTLVNDTGAQFDVEGYFAQRQKAALQGNVYNPTLGFALVGNTQNGLKYPYQPFYGGFSPRVAAAWNPGADSGILGKLLGGKDTVIRGGYGRIYGRLNGVDLVLVPLLAPGLIQAVNCQTALSNRTCAASPGTFVDAFRIGTDGKTAPVAAATQTLPQPYFPGVNNVSIAAGESLDPHFRPNAIDSFDLTIQRQLANKVTVEVGYIGRLIHHEFQAYNLNAVPYMMTKGGQTFASAYAAVSKALGCTTSASACDAKGVPANITPQPFFEAALAGTGFCTGFSSCTQAVAVNEEGNFATQSVWSLWSDLDNGGKAPGFNFPFTMLNTIGQMSSGIGVNASNGHGNYHAGFVSVRTNDWRGITMQSNFTYSKALGTGAVVQATSEYTVDDPFNLNAMYGVQPFDRKFVYNQFIVYQPPFFKSQQGIVGHLLGGWNITPIFTAGSGQPVYCNTQTNGQSFGSGDGNLFFSNEQCVFTSRYNGGTSLHGGVAGGTDANGNSVGTSTAGSTPGTQLNMFADPIAVYSQVRAPILGVDTKNPGVGPIHGLPYWNLDLSVRKNIKVTERVGFTFQFLCTNVLNHNQMSDPTLDLSDTTTWGTTTTQVNNPRQMEFGFRVSF